MARDTDTTSWHPFFRYAAALAVVCAIAILEQYLPVASVPFVLFLPGMLAIGFTLGRGPGIAGTTVSALIVACVFMTPLAPGLLTSEQVFGLMLFVPVCCSLVLVCDLLRRSLARRDEDLAAMSLANRELLESRAALEASESFLRSVLESSPDCIKILDLDARLTFMSERGKQAMEVDDFGAIEGCPWPDFWQEADNAVARDAITQALAGQVGRFQGFCPTMAGTPRWWDVVVSPVIGADGKPEKILSVSRDITASKQAEAQQQLLNHELAHRLKNTLAMIQAIANQTMRRAGSLEEARLAFDARLIALGKAQDVLTGARWESASIEAVIGNALAAHDFESGRFHTGGPPVMLSARCSLALSLALHELATNAAKYGALSRDAGRVSIVWSVDLVEGTPRFHLTWRETGGPPVRPPERKGFGSFMIERSLAGYFKGSATLEYAQDGVAFHLGGPATHKVTDFTAGEAEIFSPLTVAD